MNVNSFNTVEPTDEEILAGVRRHMAGVEGLVPLPPARSSNEPTTSRAMGSSVRTRVVFAGLAPLVLVATLLVVVVGAGLGVRSGAGPSSSTAQNRYQLTFLLASARGQVATSADLDNAVAIFKKRLDATGAAVITISKLPPDRVVVTVPGSEVSGSDVGPDEAYFEEMGSIGNLEFVPLPADVYGSMSAGVPVTPSGAVALPVPGDAFEATLPVLVGGSGIDRAASKTHALWDTTTNVWAVDVGLN